MIVSFSSLPNNKKNWKVSMDASLNEQKIMGDQETTLIRNIFIFNMLDESVSNKSS